MPARTRRRARDRPRREQPTGRDRTLLAAEIAPDISRGRIFSTLSGSDPVCTVLASCEHADGGDTLIEIDGFVPAADPRLDGFRAQLGKALHACCGSAAMRCPLGGELWPLRNRTAPRRRPSRSHAAKG